MQNPKQAQQDTSSAENTGKDRDKQKPLNSVSNQQKRTIVEDIDEGNHTIADLGELGMRGGREDNSGSTKDENFNERKEK